MIDPKSEANRLREEAADCRERIADGCASWTDDRRAGELVAVANRLDAGGGARHAAGPWEATPDGCGVRTAGDYLLVADLKARCVTAWDRGVAAWDEGTRRANAALIADAPAMLTLLKALEWAGVEDDPEGGHFSACPLCGGGDPGNPATPMESAGHDEDCELAALLDLHGRTS